MSNEQNNTKTNDMTTSNQTFKLQIFNSNACQTHSIDFDSLEELKAFVKRQDIDTRFVSVRNWAWTILNLKRGWTW